MASHGRGGRQRGHDYECTGALYIAERLFGYDGTLTAKDDNGRLLCPIQTTRNIVKSSKGDLAMRLDGRWVPWVATDRPFPQGQRWSIECKSVGDVDRFPPRSLVDDYLEQAALNLRVDLNGDGRTCVLIDRYRQPTGASWVMIPDQRGGPDPYRLLTLDQFLDQEM